MAFMVVSRVLVSGKDDCRTEKTFRAMLKAKQVIYGTGTPSPNVTIDLGPHDHLE